MRIGQSFFNVLNGGCVLGGFFPFTLSLFTRLLLQLFLVAYSRKVKDLECRGEVVLLLFFFLSLFGLDYFQSAFLVNQVVFATEISHLFI